jgi:ATP-dependent DNA helicase HFM1/MER3
MTACSDLVNLIWSDLFVTAQGYAPAKNDFLFERRLSDQVFGVVAEHSKGRPALVFCR